MTDHPFTPHADSFQTAWVDMCQRSRIGTQPPVEELEAEFDRFIERVKRDAAREALYGYADALNENPHAAVWGWHDFVRDARDWADTIYPIPEETP